MQGNLAWLFLCNSYLTFGPVENVMRNLTIVVFLLCPLLHGIPWLWDGWAGMVLAWLGMVAGMWLASSASPWNRLWCLWIWGTLSIGIAFHWSPDAMTYTLSSEYWLGFLVAMPLILWDGLRLALGYWLGARLCRDRRLLWLSTAVWSILLEEFMPGVFPWRLGMMQLSWPWWLQAVDVFGAGWSTFIAFAVAGLILQAIEYLPKLASQRSVDGVNQSQPEPGRQANADLASSQASRRASGWVVALAPSLLLLNTVLLVELAVMARGHSCGTARAYGSSSS